MSDVATLLRNWLLLGFSFGEAAWSAEFGYSWQTTVVSDPLYRPWSVSLQARLRDLEQRNDPRREWALAMQFDKQLGNGRPLAVVAHDLRELPLTKTSTVLSEKLGDLFHMQNLAAESLKAYDALQAKPSPQQAIRLLLACVDAQAALGMDMGNGHGDSPNAPATPEGSPRLPGAVKFSAKAAWPCERATWR